eukprot:gnl/TRDRNA2_/TRDRNA2_87699_c0_seq1.p1 gnl/TRDRNA2_/TRDRNA2_87699_c0~~gnl/TRDRNA2_/TRDRNA2_87699_c0_seq1.p1  ORF type:complete len:395 (-),score=77.70 gnl/TRDRNA2_/TRDRNA2_87699_c0_seq1:26-1210(-)
MSSVASRVGTEAPSQPFAETMLRVAQAEHRTGGAAAWEGRGQLIGEWPDGYRGNIGHNVSEGLQHVVGRGIHRVTFPAGEPMGIAFMPLSEDRGAAVAGVFSGSPAEQFGVTYDMVLHSVENYTDTVALGDLPYASVLAAVENGLPQAPLTISFSTAIPLNRLYAMEMPAGPVFDAIASFEGRLEKWCRANVDASNAVSSLLAATERPLPLFAETVTKAFIGEPGSVTAAHVDIAPDLELAHGLVGSKFIGVATQSATERLLDEHVPEEHSEATIVPTDRPLHASEAALLGDKEVNLAWLLPGDLCVFSSGALHFASNGADEMNAALYHGIVTEASLPSLMRAFSRGSEGDDGQLSVEAEQILSHKFSSSVMMLKNGSRLELTSSARQLAADHT